MDLITIAKFVGPVSSGIFAGYTWSLSHATIPSILAAKDEVTRAKQWRIQYIQGFYLAVPCTAMNLASWLYLAVISEPNLRWLFVLAAIGSGSGTVFAWTFLRATNGALSNKAQQLVGDWPGTFTIPLTYSNREKRSIALEKRENVEQLVQRWGRLNLARSLVLIAGTIFGVLGVALL